MSGALGGLKVVDFTDDSGRFATKLLAEFGADVVRVSSHTNPGLPLRDDLMAVDGVAGAPSVGCDGGSVDGTSLTTTGGRVAGTSSVGGDGVAGAPSVGGGGVAGAPSVGGDGGSVDGAPSATTGIASWWYDHNKRAHSVDLDTPQGRDAYRQLATAADVIVETQPPGRLADLGLDHQHLAAANPTLTQVSITPYGRSGPKAEHHGTDLTAAAASGVMALTGLPDRPLNIWGAQTANYAGFYAAISALAAHLASRRTGRGTHIDLSTHEAVTGSIENLLMQYFFDDQLPLPKVAARQGALHWLRAYDLARCVDGYVMITPTPTPDLLLEWMMETGCSEAGKWHGIDPSELLLQVDDVMDQVRTWVAPQQMAELWWEAQRRHVAFGGVLSIEEVCAIPQFAHRGFFSETNGVTMPARLVRLSGTAEGRGTVPRTPPPSADTPLEQLLGSWSGLPAEPAPASEAPAEPTPSDSAPAGSQQIEATTAAPTSTRPLEGIRVADFTWVLAGPFATRLLGDLGADVVRVQTEERSTVVNSPDFPYYFVWNRSKRSATLNIKHPRGLEAARRLIEQSDVLVENYSAGVFASWGLTPEVVLEWNPRIVFVSMSGCGHDGPWQHVISYAPTVHAVSGITHLTNFADRGDVGPGFSLNDHLAGFSAAYATLAALAERERSGRGQYVDMAQLEVGTYSIGPAVIAQLAGAEPPVPAGNADGVFGYAPNGVYGCADGFVAVSCPSDEAWRALCGVLDDGSPAAQSSGTSAGEPLPDNLEALTVEQRRAAADTIGVSIASWCALQSADDAAATLQAAGVPAAAVADADDLFNCPQHAARGYWQPVKHPHFGDRTVDSFPALFDGERLVAERLSPHYLGEHNFEVWTDVAGYGFDEVAEGVGDGLFS